MEKMAIVRGARKGGRLRRFRRKTRAGTAPKVPGQRLPAPRAGALAGLGAELRAGRGLAAIKCAT